MEKKIKQNFFEKKNIQNAWDYIKNAKTIVLLTHYKPDGDGISACAAFEYFLNNAFSGTKTIYAIFPTESEFDLKRLPSHVLINSHEAIPDLIVQFDTANYDRLYYPEQFKNIPFINVDHHVSNNISGTLNFVDATAASACEVLYDLMLEWSSKSIDKKVSETLLVGILYDTQVFHTQSTQPKTLRLAADLIDAGANLFEITNELLANKNPAIIKFWGNILSNIKISKNHKAAWVVISQNDLKKYGLRLSSLAGFSNFLAEISDIDVAVLIYETEEGFSKISFRSKRTDVNKIAKYFGGGGHIYAAGALIKKPISEVSAQISEIVETI